MMTQEFGELNVKENFLEVVFFLIELLGKSLKFLFFHSAFFKQHCDHTCQAPENTKKYFTNTRVVTVHVFVLKIFSTVLLVCLPNKYSNVLMTARVELHWKHPVLYIVTFDKKQSLIFRLCPFSSGNSNNEWRFGALWFGTTDRCINASVQRQCGAWNTLIPSSLLLVLTRNKHEWSSHTSCNRSISVSTTERHQNKMPRSISFTSDKQVISVHSSLVRREMKSREEHFTKY